MGNRSPEQGGDHIVTDTLVSNIVTRINTEMTDIENVEAVLSYSGDCVRAPIKKIYLAFMTGANNVSHYNDETTRKCCRVNKISISMNCYSPANLAAETVIAKAEAVLDRLCDHFNGEMIGYSLEKAKLDDDSKAVKIPCTLFFRYESCPAYDTADSTLLPYAEFLCKIHTANADIHVTDKEKAFLQNPVVTGRYTGSGAEERDVFLGFKPKMLIIYELGSQLVSYDAENSAAIYRFAFCGSGGNTRGLTLTATGFRISEAIAVRTGGAICQLNELLINYAYIAVQ